MAAGDGIASVCESAPHILRLTRRCSLCEHACDNLARPSLPDIHNADDRRAQRFRPVHTWRCARATIRSLTRPRACSAELPSEKRWFSIWTALALWLAFISAAETISVRGGASHGEGHSVTSQLLGALMDAGSRRQNSGYFQKGMVEPRSVRTPFQAISPHASIRRKLRWRQPPPSHPMP